MIREADQPIEFLGQNLILLPEKALFWVQKKTLILSDLHLGKSGHFQKHGIAVPTTVNLNNIARLEQLAKAFNPDTIIFVGDLFHSDMNSEWSDFINWRASNSEIRMFLVIGNHAFYPPENYESMGLQCVHQLASPPFLFIHELPDTESETPNYPICGHIHPSVRLKGKGRQSVRVSCFYFGEYHAILPAFGSFTGTSTLKPKKGDKVFALVQGEILEI